MRSSLLLLFYVGSIFLAERTSAENQHVAMLKKSPSIRGDDYRCGEMIKVVNHLKRLGKNECLRVLRKYLANDGEDNKVLVICRLAFDNPKGWTNPRRGQPVPVINGSVAKQFPVFPIVLSKRVPFLLIWGYQYDGKAQSAETCLKVCEELSLIKDDYPLEGYEKAAQALIRTDSFRKLYDEKDLPAMVKMVLKQAKPVAASSAPSP